MSEANKNKPGGGNDPHGARASGASDLVNELHREIGKAREEALLEVEKGVVIRFIREKTRDKTMNLIDFWEMIGKVPEKTLKGLTVGDVFGSDKKSKSQKPEPSERANKAKVRSSADGIVDILKKNASGLTRDELETVHHVKFAKQALALLKSEKKVISPGKGPTGKWKLK